ncbi:MAG: adenylyl-sulfate kinase [Candidatus Magasanikbacteria bacterium]|nr:adenylyl-sulfate kinase [Candidatus Magasanikbacteria bacterium]
MKDIIESLHKKELVRLVTAGSVDDGKSTLIGRLLYDLGEVYTDQVEALKKQERIDGEIDFSLITDGLDAEREQKITIDVAYRYFSTKSRRFIIADVPGHEEYTRNMVTGASNAQIAMVLIDARKGLLTQTKRHLFIASRLGIPHMVVVINKMDVIGYSEEQFNIIKEECASFCAKLHIKDLQFIPISSLKGDMIVDRGKKLDWYQGRTVVDYLENVQVATDRNLIDFRFPVQYIIRPNQDFRGYAGKIEGGAIREGESVMILPSKKTTKIKTIHIGEKQVASAFNPQSVVLELSEDIDISRGDMVVREKNIPHMGNTFEAHMFWFANIPLEKHKRYILKHSTKTTPCFITEIVHKINVDTAHREETNTLPFNEMGRVHVRALDVVFFDNYTKNRHTGSAIIIDEETHNTVGAAIITNPLTDSCNSKKDIIESGITKPHKGGVLWFTGLSGSGKSTIANAVCTRLQECGYKVERLDGDVLRSGITAHLGFSKEDRIKNIDIAGHAAKLLAKHGVIVVASFISPIKEQREEMKKNIDNFTEIYVNTPVEVCEKRDPKGRYKKARSGELENFTGVTSIYEEPDNPDILLETENTIIEECVANVLSFTNLLKK